MADATSYEPGGSGGGVPSTRSINAGTGLSGGGTLASDRTISLATLSPSPAGTYASPTELVINSRGQVTSITAGSGGNAPQHWIHSAIVGNTNIAGTRWMLPGHHYQAYPSTVRASFFTYSKIGSSPGRIIHGNITNGLNLGPGYSADRALVATKIKGIAVKVVNGLVSSETFAAIIEIKPSGGSFSDLSGSTTTATSSTQELFTALDQSLTNGDTVAVRIEIGGTPTAVTYEVSLLVE